MHRLYFRLLFLSCLNVSTLFGQTSILLDSLVATCNTYPNADTTKVNMLLKISLEYMKSTPAKGVEAAQEAAIILPLLASSPTTSHATIYGQELYLLFSFAKIP